MEKKKKITELNPAQNTLFPDLNPIKENDLKLNIRAKKKKKKRQQPSLKIIMIYFQNKQTKNTQTPASPLSDAHTQCKTRAYFYTDRHNTITHKNTAHTAMDSWLNCKQLFCKYFHAGFLLLHHRWKVYRSIQYALNSQTLIYSLIYMTF